MDKLSRIIIEDEPLALEKTKDFVDNSDPAFSHPVFIGKDADKSALINLAEKKARQGFRLLLILLEMQKINFLDSTGKIVYSLPNKENH
jgi:hypothetical protein